MQTFIVQEAEVGGQLEFWSRLLRRAGISRQTDSCQEAHLRLLDAKFIKKELAGCKPLVLELRQRYGRNKYARLWSNDVIGFRLRPDLPWATKAEPRRVFYIGAPDIQTRTFTWAYPTLGLSFTQVFDKPYFPHERRPNWAELWYTGILDGGRTGHFQLSVNSDESYNLKEVK